MCGLPEQLLTCKQACQGPVFEGALRTPQRVQVGFVERRSVYFRWRSCHVRQSPDVRCSAQNHRSLKRPPFGFGDIWHSNNVTHRQHQRLPHDLDHPVQSVWQLSHHRKRRDCRLAGWPAGLPAHTRGNWTHLDGGTLTAAVPAFAVTPVMSRAQQDGAARGCGPGRDFVAVAMVLQDASAAQLLST